MPRRSLLSAEQFVRLFDVPATPAEMAKHYLLSPDDLLLVKAKRRSMNRLGFAVQLCLLRHPGQGLSPSQQGVTTLNGQDSTLSGANREHSYRRVRRFADLRFGG